MPLGQAVDAFLLEHDLAPATRLAYLRTLERLACEVGANTPLVALDPPRLGAFVKDRWDTAAPATWNRQVATLRSATAFWSKRGWLEHGGAHRFRGDSS